MVLLGYDQNREGIKEWVDEMYKDQQSSQYFDGTAIHWYESTYDYFPEALQYAHHKAPNKYLIQTEACIDSEVPVWKDDSWYWKKKLQIGVMTGVRRIKNTFTQNMLRQIDMHEISLVV